MTVPKNEQRSAATDTVLNYIKACRDAYLFYQAKRQDVHGKQILSNSEKYYIADHGIREAVFGGNMRDINPVLENIVYMELLRRGYSVYVGKERDRCDAVNSHFDDLNCKNCTKSDGKICKN